MNVNVTATTEQPHEPNVELPLAEARKAVAAEHGRIPTGPRAGGVKVYVAGEPATRRT